MLKKFFKRDELVLACCPKRGFIKKIGHISQNFQWVQILNLFSSTFSVPTQIRETSQCLNKRLQSMQLINIWLSARNLD